MLGDVDPERDRRRFARPGGHRRRSARDGAGAHRRLRLGWRVRRPPRHRGSGHHVRDELPGGAGRGATRGPGPAVASSSTGDSRNEAKAKELDALLQEVEALTRRQRAEGRQARGPEQPVRAHRGGCCGDRGRGSGRRGRPRRLQPQPRLPPGPVHARRHRRPPAGRPGRRQRALASGAEAMMIQDQRVISTSAVRCVGNTLILQGRVYCAAVPDPGHRRPVDSDAARPGRRPDDPDLPRLRRGGRTGLAGPPTRRSSSRPTREPSTSPTPRRSADRRAPMPRLTPPLACSSSTTTTASSAPSSATSSSSAPSAGVVRNDAVETSAA